jgi:hypothetical protein
MRLLILILIFFTSCSPIRRHDRLVRKYPYVHTTDSVKLIDTISIVTEKVSTDTVFQIKELPDGVVVEKKNLKIKLRTIKDSIYVYGECDTIFIDKVIERTVPIKYYETNKTNWLLILFLLSIILILIFIRK